MQPESGQALIEWALLLVLFGQLFVALAVFAEWFVARQELLAVTKEGALLYSAGRLEIPEVKRLMRRALQRGRPSLDVPLDDIFVGSSDDNQAAFMKLDKVSVRYRPATISFAVFRKFIGGIMRDQTCSAVWPSWRARFWPAGGLAKNVKSLRYGLISLIVVLAAFLWGPEILKGKAGLGNDDMIPVLVADQYIPAFSIVKEKMIDRPVLPQRLCPARSAACGS